MSGTSVIHGIGNGHLSVRASEHGAELQSICAADGTEYLWQGDARYWSDRAPTIFPYVARLTDGIYTCEGREYAMPIHGFAPYADFTFEDVGPGCMRFVLADSAETLASYPFHFVFSVEYRLEGTSLSIVYSVENRGERPMYFGTGVHPGINVPLEPGVPFESYKILFGNACSPQRVNFTPDCFIAGGSTPFDLQNGQEIPLRHDIFDDDAIILKDTARKLRLCSPLGKRAVTFEFPNYPIFGLWHWPGKDAPYICLEAWSSLPSRKGVVEDLATQPDLVCLPANEIWRNAVTLSFE